MFCFFFPTLLSVVWHCWSPPVDWWQEGYPACRKLSVVLQTEFESWILLHNFDYFIRILGSRWNLLPSVCNSVQTICSTHFRALVVTSAVSIISCWSDPVCFATFWRRLAQVIVENWPSVKSHVAQCCFLLPLSSVLPVFATEMFSSSRWSVTSRNDDQRTLRHRVCHAAEGCAGSWPIRYDMKESTVWRSDGSDGREFQSRIVRGKNKLALMA